MFGRWFNVRPNVRNLKTAANGVDMRSQIVVALTDYSNDAHAQLNASCQCNVTYKTKVTIRSSRFNFEVRMINTFVVGSLNILITTYRSPILSLED